MKTNIRNYAIREQEKLREKIRSMYALRDAILKKRDDDRSFSEKPKKMILTELDEVIDLGLEEFYSLRMS